MKLAYILRNWVYMTLLSSLFGVLGLLLVPEPENFGEVSKTEPTPITSLAYYTAAIMFVMNMPAGVLLGHCRYRIDEMKVYVDENPTKK